MTPRKLISLLATIDADLLASQQGTIKFNQTEFEGAETIFVHATNGNVDPVKSNKFNHHYMAYYVMTNTAEIKVFTQYLSLSLKWN